MTKCKQDVKWLSNMAFTKMVGDDKIFTKTSKHSQSTECI